MKSLTILALVGLLAVALGSGCLNSIPNCDTTHDYFAGHSTFDSHSYVVLTSHKYWLELNITDPNHRGPPPSNDEPPDFTHVYQYALVQCGCPDPAVYIFIIFMFIIEVTDLLFMYQLKILVTQNLMYSPC